MHCVRASISARRRAHISHGSPSPVMSSTASSQDMGCTAADTRCGVTGHRVGCEGMQHSWQAQLADILTVADILAVTYCLCCKGCTPSMPDTRLLQTMTHHEDAVDLLRCGVVPVKLIRHDDQVRAEFLGLSHPHVGAHPKRPRRVVGR